MTVAVAVSVTIALPQHSLTSPFFQTGTWASWVPHLVNPQMFRRPGPRAGATQEASLSFSFV